MQIPGPNNEMVSSSAVIPHDYEQAAGSPLASYTIAATASWDATPVNVAEALDQLAARLRANGG